MKSNCECLRCGFVPYSTAYSPDKCPNCEEPIPKPKSQCMKRWLTPGSRSLAASLAALCLLALIEYHGEGWKAVCLILGAFLFIGLAFHVSHEAKD